MSFRKRASAFSTLTRRNNIHQNTMLSLFSNTYTTSNEHLYIASFHQAYKTLWDLFRTQIDNYKESAKLWITATFIFLLLLCSHLNVMSSISRKDYYQWGRQAKMQGWQVSSIAAMWGWDRQKNLKWSGEM